MALASPTSSAKNDVGSGVRALVLAPTRELAHQIHNECLKLGQGRKWRIILFSKATASTLADRSVRDKVGSSIAAFHVLLRICSLSNADIIISTPLRLIASLQSSKLDLHK